MFTYRDDKHESDVEILTRDADDAVRYTNQPATDAKTGDDVPGASVARSGLPAWREWRTHRMDWGEGVTRWFVDGREVAESRYSVSERTEGLVMNVWGDGGSWSGVMPVGGVVGLQVQWVEVLFNTSGEKDGRALVKRKDRDCKIVCDVDGVSRVGWPEVRFTAGSVEGRGFRGSQLSTILMGVFWISIFWTI
jgi:beta-glucanase (GH16 family)